MKVLALEPIEEYVPSREDAVQAEKAVKFLDALDKKAFAQCKFLLKTPSASENLYLPVGFIKYMVDVLHQVAQGNTVTFIPSTKEFTSQEAADFLNVSRPFLVKLLETGEIPFHRVGSHRRIRATDLISYKRKMLKSSMDALEQLAKQAQDEKLGYE